MASNVRVIGVVTAGESATSAELEARTDTYLTNIPNDVSVHYPEPTGYTISGKPVVQGKPFMPFESADLSQAGLTEWVNLAGGSSPNAPAFQEVYLRALDLDGNWTWWRGIFRRPSAASAPPQYQDIRSGIKTIITDLVKV